MSATINANLFANYFRATYVGRPIARGGGADEGDGDGGGAEGGGGDGGGGEGGGGDGVGEGDGEGGGEGALGEGGFAVVGPAVADAAPTVHIPGFTHPVTEHQLDHLHMHCACTARAPHMHWTCTCTCTPAPAHLHLHTCTHAHAHAQTGYMHGGTHLLTYLLLPPLTH